MNGIRICVEWLEQLARRRTLAGSTECSRRQPTARADCLSDLTSENLVCAA